MSQAMRNYTGRIQISKIYLINNFKSKKVGHQIRETGRDETTGDDGRSCYAIEVTENRRRRNHSLQN